MRRFAATAVCTRVWRARTMATEKLSWGFCKRVTEDGMYGDGGGLWLQVRGNGKSWVFRWTDRRTKQERIIGLGSMSTFDIVEAREKARRCRQLLTEGKCPKAERDGERLDAAHRAGLARTFQQVWSEFYDAKTRHLRLVSRKGVIYDMNAHVLPKIGKMPI